MRSVAPLKAGSAASQKSWLVVKRKPTFGRSTTTTLHTIHTANESMSAGTEIHKLRRAICSPSRLQNSGFSGSQCVRSLAFMTHRNSIVTVEEAHGFFTYALRRR